MEVIIRYITLDGACFILVLAYGIFDEHPYIQLTTDVRKYMGKSAFFDSLVNYRDVNNTFKYGIMFHAPMRRFQLELMYCFTFIFHRLSIQYMYVSVVLPRKI